MYSFRLCSKWGIKHRTFFSWPDRSCGSMEASHWGKTCPLWGKRAHSVSWAGMRNLRGQPGHIAVIQQTQLRRPNLCAPKLLLHSERLICPVTVSRRQSHGCWLSQQGTPVILYFISIRAHCHHFCWAGDTDQGHRSVRRTSDWHSLVARVC